MGVRAVLELSDGGKVRMNAAAVNGFVTTFSEVMTDIATTDAQIEAATAARH